MSIAVSRVSKTFLIVSMLVRTVDSDLMSGVKKIFGSEDKKELVDPYFLFSFAGQEVREPNLFVK